MQRNYFLIFWVKPYPTTHELVEAVLHVGGDDHHLHEAAEAHEDDADRGDRAHLLGNRREDEVLLDDRDTVRHVLVEAEAREAAGADREERLRDLVALIVDVRPRMIHANTRFRTCEKA